MPPNRAAMPSRPVAAGGSLARGSCLRCSCLPKQHRPLIIPNFERLFPAGGGCEIPRAGGEACPRWCGKSGRHHREPLAARTRPAHHPREPGWPGRAMRGLTPEAGERNGERPPGVSDTENATGVVVIGTEICGLSSCSSREPYRVGPSRGTDGSNPSPSSGESSTNLSLYPHSAIEAAARHSPPITRCNWRAMLQPGSGITQRTKDGYPGRVCARC